MPSCDYPTYPPSLPLSAPYLNGTLYTRAPVMRTVPLPPCPDHDHPMPSPPHRNPTTALTSAPRVHPALSAASTVVRYDFARDPQMIRMSSSSEYAFFPSHDPVSSPSIFVLHVHCEATGHTIAVCTGNRAVTCLDVMVQLHRFLQGEMESEEWRGVRGARRSAMKKSYERRTGFAYSASARMRMVDYLLGRTRFKRFVPEYDGDSTWLLQTR